jgi:NAD(P)-dependent dehydrogenase (short-subunit alcohol dehydrogenase family)
VRVNAICPTWVRTAMVADAFERQPALVDVMKSAVPLKRMAEPIEIAEVVMFLCSASASYLSGIGMVIDAGATLTMNLN